MYNNFSQHSPNPLTMAQAPPPDYEQMVSTSNMLEHQRAFEECRSKWHSTGHVPTLSTTGFRTSLPATSTNLIQNPLCSEYASVDIQNINHYRSLQPPCVIPVTATPPTATPAASYNLGHYFPRVASEPPSRKSYQTSNRNGDPLKVKKDRQFQKYTKFNKSSHFFEH